MIRTVFAIAALAVSVSANCDNSCSGHGTCTTDDVCSCYDNWGVGLSMDSGDCSDRICPFEIAWVDSPNGAGKFHRYAECAGRGICNRGSGLCECFEGYEGEACQRTSCPNLCSGHGTCEYIEDMTFYAVWNDYSVYDFKESAATFDYPWWDKGKTRGCVCDAQYTDVDCSKRMCPYGTDILAAREDLLLSEKYHIQRLTLKPENGDLNAILGHTFALTFVSRLNESFTTYPIVLNYDTGSTSALTDFANDVRLALLHLPNQVIDDCQVRALKRSPTANGQHIDIEVTFNGAAVQGPQNWLIVEDYECSAGCTPRITGLGLETVELIVGGGSRGFSNVSSTQDAIFNSYECGRRGKCDYDTGLCQCFEGYTGENCNTLTTLV